MKKIVIFLMALLIMLTSYAQTESSHLLFKGIPIDGALSTFVSKLKQKGFKENLNYPNLLNGTFAGFPNCKIVVQQDTEKDLVYGIGVIFEDTDSWKILYSNYIHLKKMLTIKYGGPISEIEEFQRPDYATDDNARIHEIKMDRGNFKSLFANEKGQISLQISQVEHTHCYVTLIYLDNQNADISNGNVIDDL